MSKIKIALDCGHGLYTKGKQTIQTPPIKEWSLNNLVGHYIEKGLEKFVDVEILRVDDIFGRYDIPLPDRKKRALDWGATIYLSIHHNANEKVNVGTGTSVYRSLHDKTNFGETLAFNLAKYTKMYNRGCKTRKFPNQPEKDYYYVLREIPIQSYLLEGGFMTNWTDLKTITTIEGAKLYAYGVVESLRQYYNLKEKTSIVGEFEKDFDVIDLRVYDAKAGQKILLERV